MLKGKKKIEDMKIYKINPKLFLKKFKSVKQGFKSRVHSKNDNEGILADP